MPNTPPVPGTDDSQQPGSAAAAAPSPPDLKDFEQRISESLLQKVETELVDKLAGKVADITVQRMKPTGQATATGSAPSSKDNVSAGTQDNADEDSHSTRKDRENTYSSWGDSSWDWVPDRWYTRWSSSRDWDERDQRPYFSHLNIPEFGGNPDGFNKYQYLVKNLKSQISTKDLKFLGPALIAKFKGALLDDFQRQELDSSVYAKDSGVDDLMAFLKKRINITDLQIEKQCFEEYFYKLKRGKDSYNKYQNDEEAAYRKLQRVLKESDTGDNDYSSDDGVIDENGKRKPLFRLPKRLRGWFFLERAGIPERDQPSLLNVSGGTHI